MSKDQNSTLSNLLCLEDSNVCFNGLENDHGFLWDHQSNQEQFLDNNKSQPLETFLMYGEEIVKEMVEMEKEHLPRHDYLQRLRDRDLDQNIRREALDWICRAHFYHNFDPQSFCLAINYLDRFLSVYDLPKDKSWTMQLLALVCLSLGAKMVETKKPLCICLQVAKPKYLFEARTIQRMELLVLSTLKWRMHVVTPISFINYFLHKLLNNQQLLVSSFSRSEQLILSMVEGIDFLEFKPSEIAAAVAIFVAKEEQTTDVDKNFSYFQYVEKGKVMKCIELIKDLAVIYGSTTTPPTKMGSTVATCVLQSPDGVLEAPCLSYTTNNKTTDSCECDNSSHDSPDTKRRKEDDNTPAESDS